MDRWGVKLLRDYMTDMRSRQREVKKHNAWFREQVQIGLDSANAGNLMSNEDVEEKFSARRAKTRLRLDEPPCT